MPSNKNTTTVNTTKVSDEYVSDINSNALIDINNTSYYIQDDWFEIARKYFHVDPDDVESISMLKAGLFGYTNEILSNEIKNNVYHRNIIYDEHFLNTASFPESIYNFSKMFNYDIDFAKPSHCRINFAIAREDLINNKFKEEVEYETGSVTNKRTTYKLVINNQYVFLLGSFQFRLPYPVVITFKETADKTDFSLTAYYDTSNSDFPFLTLSTEYIKMWSEFENGKRMVYLGLDLFQLTYKEQDFNVTSDDISDNLFYSVLFSEQLAFFEVFYTYNGETIKLNTYFNNTFQPKNDEKFCYYAVVDSDELLISFSANAGSFRPALNSILTVRVYTTRGSEGNFSYIGSKVSVNFNNTGEFDRIPISIIPITECTGGIDDPTYTEVKNGIIDKFAVRDNLIIDNDLEVHFKNVNRTNMVNNSTIEWIKKRNDVLKRLYIAYLTIRDRDKKVIPTNTAPTLLVESEYLKKYNYCIKENTRVVFDYKKNQYIVDENATIKDDKNYLFYRFPFLMNIQNDPILVGNYFSTYIDEEVNMLFNYINPHIDDNFSLQSLKIYKDNIYDSKYTFSVNLNSTYKSIESDYIILRLLICNENDVPYGFIDLEPQKSDDDNFVNKFYYEGYLDVNQSKAIENNKLIVGELYNPDGGANPEDILTNVPIANNILLKLGVLIKSTETNYKHGLFGNMTDIKDYTTAVIYNSESETEIFINMYNYMESDVRTPNEMKKALGQEEYNKLYGNKNYYFIKQFPIIEETYFENASQNFFNVWKIYVDIVRDSINYLENNTSVDIKLTNTYGKSNYYYSSFTYSEDTNEIIYDYIENVQLDINLKLYLNYYIDDDTDLAIKTYISDYLESCNEGKLFPISNLITKLETKFDIIKYIEFFKIGDDTTQKIKSNFTSLLDITDKEELENFVPEYINIKKKLDLSQKKFETEENEDHEEVQVPNIDYNRTLTYPYNYNINVTYVYS